MRLSLDTIRRHTMGCDRLEDACGAVRFRRFGPDMEAFYAEPEGRLIRRDCPAGVRIRFISDSPTLALGLGFGGAARGIYKATVLTDDAVFELGPDEAMPTWTGAIPPFADKRERLYDVWLPHMAVTELLYLDLADGATVSDAPACALRWLAYGDSITQGMTVRLPHETHIARVTRALGAETRNLGVGGERIQAFMADTVPEWPFDLCTIAYGVNDFNHNATLDSFTDAARALAARLTGQRPGKPVFFISPIPYLTDKTHNANGDTLDDFRAALDSVASAFQDVKSISGTGLVEAEATMFVDGCHPNERGAAMYADGLLSAIRPALA